MEYQFRDTDFLQICCLNSPMFLKYPCSQPECLQRLHDIWLQFSNCPSASWLGSGSKKRWYKHPGVRYDMNFEENLNQPEQNGFLFGFDILMCLRFADQTLWHHQSFRHSQVENDLGIPDFLFSSLETDQLALRHPFARKHILLQPHQKTGGWTP